MTQKNESFLSRKFDQLFSLISKFTLWFFQFLSFKTAESFSKINEIKEKSKDLVTTNLLLAEEHFENKRFFDAKLRYKIVLKMDKSNFIALVRLGYIYMEEKKFGKAEESFLLAKQFTTNEEDIKDINDILEEIKTYKS